jgi:valyl-tRNA synthetase
MSRYNPKAIEGKWYAHWMEKNYFHSVPDEREAYTIVIPPPNVTGVLHMGHMLNNTIQDVLVRKARLEGYNACWVPGTDHASIATEAKVVQMLRERGIRKADLSREEFLEYAWEWKEKYGGIILDQLQKLGASCDWQRTRFTMEPKLSKAVVKVFVDLYQKGRIYRGLRVTNWDPEAKTVLSNEEVNYSEEKSTLYYVRYRVEGSTDKWVTIATTRPETIMGDTAVCINPNDARYAHLHGKRCIVPLVERAVPIILDTYVDMEFGTGCLKVTPAHDANDYQLGVKHGLDIIDTINDDGTMSEAAQFFIGKDRFEARKLVAAELQARDHIVKTEEYNNKVGRSERSNAIIEPKLTEQWFVDMKAFAKTALDAVENGEVRFFPPHIFNMYYNWLNADNIRDWCISRQLWWGHRVPAWYYGGEVFVAETVTEALVLAQAKFNDKNLTINDLKQDEDALDTWFSSWLWPLSVFDGFETQEELKYYYPTSVLVTGWDIIFFWVARMVMAGYEWSEELLGSDFVREKGRQPFKDVYFTGMVRDQFRRKMSKQFGNSPDALALIETYGADGVRFGMLSSAAAGNDIVFDAPFDKASGKVLNESEKCAQGLNFCNKIWNATRLVKGWEVADAPQSEAARLAGLWFKNALSKMLVQLGQSFKEYRLSEALMDLYNFIWNEFFSEYLEYIKPPFGQPIDRTTRDEAIAFFEQLMVMLHPFMPFVTEEIWHQLRERAEGDDCIVSSYPQAGDFDEGLLKTMATAGDIITKVRDIRTKNGLKKHEPLPLFLERSASAEAFFATPAIKELLLKMAVLESLDYCAGEVANAVSFIAGTEKYYLALRQEIDVAAEREKLLKDLEYQKGFLEMVEKKLGNERFVANAPEAVLAKERQKQADAQAKIAILEESLKGLKGV